MVTQYLLDGSQEIAEYDGTGTLLRRYVFGPGIDEPVATIAAAGTKSYNHQDALGSVIALSDGTTGAVGDKYTYSVYGESPSLAGNAFRYTGRRVDAETGLYYYRARYYSPRLGRFLQPDPIGYQGGLNLYAYVGGDPLNLTDPSGLIQEAVGNAANSLIQNHPQAVGGTLVGLGGALALTGIGSGPGVATAGAGVAILSGAIVVTDAAAVAVGAAAVATGTVLMNQNQGDQGSSSSSSSGGGTSGPSSTYDTSITSPGSQYPNVSTNVTATDFQATLQQNGYNVVKQTSGSNGPVTVLSNGNSTYTIYTRGRVLANLAPQYFGPNGNSVKFSLSGP